MRKDVLAALSIIGVGATIYFVASRHNSPSGTAPGAVTSIEKTKVTDDQPQARSNILNPQMGAQAGLSSGKGVGAEKAATPPQDGKTSNLVIGKVEPEKKAPTCFQAEYQVPETDIPQILDLGKDIQLNSKTVCVRVNGSPVAFQFKEKAKNQIIIGSLHESKNDVKVSYCVGVSKCSDPCVVKQDRFLAALGGEDDLKATGKEEGVLSAEEQELEKELASFQALRLSKEQKVFGPKQVTAACQKDAS